jgi:CheY-like chemotaxis protein
MNSPVILVIDDDALVRDIIKRDLEMAGYRVVVAGDGREGLAQYWSVAPDLLIIDLIMPEMDGIEVITELRKRRINTRILAISGGGRLGNRDILQVAHALGADDILAKPFQLADLTDKVQRLLAAPPG